MTHRQKLLHEEVVRISDIFQLGLSIDDNDWFYKFIQRMDKNKVWEKDLFLGLDFLSKEFLDEFPTLKPDVIRHNPLMVLYLVGFYESLTWIRSAYGGNPFVWFIREIKDHLKDEWVENKIDMFDNTCLSYSDFSYSNRDKESAWYYVFKSTSISDGFKEKYKHKSIYTDIHNSAGEANNKKAMAYYDPKFIKIEKGVRV